MNLRRECSERAGCVALRRARSTKRPVGIYNCAEAGLDCGDGRWATICEDHGTIIAHTSKATALRLAAAPEEWCAECGDET